MTGTAIRATALTVAMLAATSASGYELSPYVAHFAGAAPNATEIADINGDGRADVLLATDFYFDPATDYHLFAFLQAEDGTLSAPVSAPYGSQTNRVGIEVLDLEGDGSNETVIGHNQGISVARWNGSGFTMDLFPGPHSNDVLVSLDVDKDGIVDIVGVTWSNYGTVFHGDGLGGFDRITSIPLPLRGYNDAEVADMNGDGHDDLVLSSGQGLPTGVYVLYHDGIGGLQDPQFYALPDSPRGIAIGDFNQDGLNDVLATRGRNSPTSVHILAGLPDGTMALETSYASHDIPDVTEAADVDGDGFDDAVVLHGGWTTAGVYLGNGAGGLDPELRFPIPYASSYAAEGLALGDVNSDGCTDAAIADYNYGLVLLHGAGCVAPPPPPVVDIAVTGGRLGKTSHAFTVSHVGGDASADSVMIDVAFTPDRGTSPHAIGVPSGCAQTGFGWTIRFTCEIGQLAAGESKALLFDLNTRHAGADASVSTTTDEVNFENNTLAY